MMRFAFVMIFVASNFGQTNKTVFPTQLATQEGNAAFALFNGSEFQQLFRASSLGALGDSSVKITGVSFRVNGASASMDAVVPRFEIRLSSTSRTPETMSKFYGVNVGADEVLAYAHNNVHLFSADSPAPRHFDLQFAFDQPFSYDRRGGNLLIDFRQTGFADPLARSIDAEGYPTFAESPFGSFANGAVSTDSYGAVMQLEWTAIPEPSVTALIALGCFLSLRRLSRGKYVDSDSD